MLRRRDGGSVDRGPTDPPVALELRSVDAAYGGMKVLFGVDLRVPAGSVVALLGANGAGKTTTLRVASGLLRPGAGRVVLRGQDLTGAGPRALARRGLCLIPEGRGIFPSLSVRENLVLQTHLRGRRAMAEVQERAFSAFPRLFERAEQVAGTLSGGEQQMLALSRALTTEPSVLLLDEISMGLAPLIVEELFTVVRTLATQGISIVMVEQLVADAMEIADYVVLLNQGIVTDVGQPVDVDDRLVASYLGETGLVDAPVPGGAAPTQAASRSEPRADTLSVGAPLATPRGTLSHLPTCPVVGTRTDVRPAEPGLPPCGMCQPIVVGDRRPDGAGGGPGAIDDDLSRSA
jgi:branched-chain amino acid transport system ATP-binding protein